MKLGAMLGDVLKSAVAAPATQRYPYVRRAAPETLRGLLHWDGANCTGCGLCAKDCPANALEVITIDKKAKRFVIRYHVDRCAYCAQCVISCRKGCLSMASDEWELANFNRDAFSIYFGDEGDVQVVLAGFTPQDA